WVPLNKRKRKHLKELGIDVVARLVERCRSILEQACDRPCKPRGSLYFRILILNEGRHGTGRRCEGVYLTIGIVLILHDPVQPFMVFVELVVAHLFSYPQEDEQRAGNAKGKAQEVDN